MEKKRHTNLYRDGDSQFTVGFCHIEERKAAIEGKLGTDQTNANECINVYKKRSGYILRFGLLMRCT